MIRRNVFKLAVIQWKAFWILRMMYPGKAGWGLNLLGKCNHPEVVDVVLLITVGFFNTF